MSRVDPRSERARPTVAAEGGCPPPRRLWEVALGATWTPAERDHVAGCPRCRAEDHRVRGTIAGDVDSAAGHDDATTDRLESHDTPSAGLGPDEVRPRSVGGPGDRSPAPPDATF